MRRKPKRRSGRPSIFDEGLTMQDLIKAYSQGYSCRKAAKILGISVRVYRKYLNAAGYKTSDTKLTPGFSIEYLNGFRIPKLLLWTKEHPHKKLPRDMKKIALITGIPFGTIRSYMRRRKQRLLKWLLSLGDLSTIKDKVLLDTEGRHIPLELITTYSIKTDNYDLSVYVDLVLKGGIYLKAHISWEDYIGLFGLTPKDAPWVLKKRDLKNPS